MRVIIRADASTQIGTGHVMRCLTLAQALRQRGAICCFVCRADPGNLIELVKQHGFDVFELPYEVNWTGAEVPPPVTAAWLGVDWRIDAEQTKNVIGETTADWLIVDHYALDSRWEGALAPCYRKLMAIDDLADRPHVCDLLLDQTYGRDAADYSPLVAAECHLLCGSQYALLRPEFAALRPYSLQRRTRPALRELLITMGGVDKNNATCQVLLSLRACSLPADCRITVVMGSTAPWLGEVRAQVQDMPWPAQMLVGVNDMAQLMSDSDFAIGAAGATSWERCCLGLPTAILVLAENQRYAARLLEQANAVRMLDLTNNFQKRLTQLINEILTSETCLTQLRDSASKVTDGQGCVHVADRLMREEKECR